MKKKTARRKRVAEIPAEEVLRPTNASSFDLIGLERRVLTARKDRIKERDDIINSVAGGAPGRIVTAQGPVEEMLDGVRCGWEGPDNERIQYADIIAADADDANRLLSEALKILKRPLEGNLVGVLVFPLRPQGWAVQRLISEDVTKHAIQQADQCRPALDLGAATDIILKSNPKLTPLNVDIVVANACNRLRKKFKGSEPTLDEVVAEALSALYRRGGAARKVADEETRQRSKTAGDQSSSKQADV